MTKSEMLSAAQADWRAYERAKDLALYWFNQGDTLKAQNYNEQAKGLKSQAEKWEQRAKGAK